MSTIEIRHRWTNGVLFAGEYPDLRAAVIAAVEVGARLDGARLDGASLVGARLDGASLDGARLVGASLDGARLDGASLDGARLDGASLDGARLDGASLVGARLDGARLDGASLVGARLDGARLDGARLDGASLDGASLDGARLDGASLVGAIWRDGILLTRRPLQLSGLDYPVTILDRHMQIGCELHSLTDWRAFDNERIARMDGRRARKFWYAYGPALLALAASDGRGLETPEAQTAAESVP